MPELPEVEVSRLGITPLTQGQTVNKIVIRQTQLRWPVPDTIHQAVGQPILSIERRAKYLLLRLATGTILVHLGMSGSLRVLAANTPFSKHDHVDLHFDNQTLLRYNDPRRFGCWLWFDKNVTIPLLDKLGPEPLSDEFSAEYMLTLASKRKVSVKQFIMQNAVVVGVGNIYASESLYNAHIHPLRQAHTLSKQEWVELVNQIKIVLQSAITQGGTTLNDFKQPNGKPGYFAQQLNVYGKANAPCPSCGDAIQSKVIGQRNTFWCDRCQQ